MPNLVDRLFLSLSSVKPVREVENERIRRADVAISVHNTGRYYDEQRTLIARDDNVLDVFTTFAVFPKSDLECAGEEHKPVRLVPMLMRPARHAGMRQREVSHHRLEPFWQLIVSIQLDQPAPSV